MIVFLLVFLASKNIYLATGGGIGLSALLIGWGLARKAPIGRRRPEPAIAQCDPRHTGSC